LTAGSASRRALPQWRTGVRLGASAGRAAVVSAVVAILLAVGWAGMRWAGGDGGGPDDRGPVVAAVASDLPGREPRPADPGADDSAPADAPVDVGRSAADRQEVPDSVEGWRAVVAELYRRRAVAFASASADQLADVYTTESPLRAPDEEHARRLAAAGEILRGFTPTVVAVTATSSPGDRVEMDLVDRWPDYDVVPTGAADGPALRTEHGRPEAGVRMVLVRTADGWRIDTAHRLP
jgi:hypothetical protein